MTRNSTSQKGSPSVADVDGGNASQSGPVRSTKFWFNDGDVILQAKGDSLYRVHRSLLSMNSNFFRDMFGTLQPPEPPEKELIDGCHVVKTQDPAKDWDTLLGTIYTPFKMNPDLEELDVDALLSMTRLAQKYQFDELHDSALRRFRKEFPGELEEFDKLFQARLESLYGYAGCRGKTWACKCPRMACHPIPLAKIINFAIDWEIKDILPVAYFMGLVTFSVEEIMTKVKYGGEAVALIPEAKRSLMLGQEQLLTYIFGHMYSWLGRGTKAGYQILPVDSCKTKAECLAARNTIGEEFLRDMQDLGRDYMIRGLRKQPLVLEKDDPHRLLCTLCNQTLLETYEDGRDAIFSDLLEIFDC